MERKKQGGFTLTLIKSFIVIATVVVVFLGMAFAAIASMHRAVYATEVFHVFFGINLSENVDGVRDCCFRRTLLASWGPCLNDEQKVVLRPLVVKRLTELCEPKPSSVLNLEPATDPDVVVQRFQELEEESQLESARKQVCDEARAVANRFDVAPNP